MHDFMKKVVVVMVVMTITFHETDLNVDFSPSSERLRLIQEVTLLTNLRDYHLFTMREVDFFREVIMVHRQTLGRGIPNLHG